MEVFAQSCQQTNKQRRKHLLLLGGGYNAEQYGSILLVAVEWTALSQRRVVYKPNSITLAGSEPVPVRSWFEVGSELVRSWFDPDSVVEFGCICQREAKRRRTIVELEHDVRRRLQTVVVNSFRRRHAYRAARTCHDDDVIAETRHCQQFSDVTPETDPCRSSATRL